MRADPAGRLAHALVSLSARRPWAVLAACLLVTAAALFLVLTRFALDSNVTRLFPQDLPWRLAERRIEAAFPQRQNLVVAVLDHPTAAGAEDAAARLAAALRARPALFRTVRRPDEDEFWRRSGLLFLPTAEVEAVAERLVEAQPWLATVAADPSARGLAGLLRSMGEGIGRGELEPERVAAVLEAVEAAARAALRGGEAAPDWLSLLSGRPAGPLERRRIILAQPALDHASLSAGAAATGVIRAEARRLGIEGLRLTGPVPMADEEFATVAEGAALTTGLSFALVAGLLTLALRSWRLIAPLLALVVVGLAWTAAFGLLAVGSFNPLSIAFAVLFVGLGVDFGIQLAVQFRAERFRGLATRPALEQAACRAGPGMGLAAVAAGGSFLCFLATDYLGIAELGLIAGGGMAIGWLLAMTLLPALVRLLRPPPEARAVGFGFLRPLDRALARHPRPAVAAAAAAAILAALSLGGLRFDTDPVNLRDPGAESVSTWRDLARDPATSPDTLDALRPDQAGAEALATRLRALPEVARATTLADLVPDAQPEKLAILADAALLLGPSLMLAPAGPPADDAAVAGALRAAGTALGGSAGEALTDLAASDAQARARFGRAALPGLLDALARARDLLAAGPVTIETLPASLRADWIGTDGTWRVEAAPAPLAGADAQARFARAVQALAPDAVGLATSALGSAATIERAFLRSGALALALVLALLWLALRSVRLSLAAVAPLLLAGLLTLAHAAVLGPALNLANIIALPLLAGQGVAYCAYFASAWRAGERELLASPLSRAVVFSAFTNGAAFGALSLSPHPGTASMGVLLGLSLLYSLGAVLLVLPPLLRLVAPRG